MLTTRSLKITVTPTTTTSTTTATTPPPSSSTLPSGNCILCKCSTFEGSDSNPGGKVCVCGHWQSYHRKKPTGLHSITGSSTSNNNLLLQTAHTNATTNNNNRRSVRLDFWESKLAEEQQQQRDSRRNTVCLSSSTNPNNYNPFRSITPAGTSFNNFNSPTIPASGNFLLPAASSSSSSSYSRSSSSSTLPNPQTQTKKHNYAPPTSSRPSEVSPFSPTSSSSSSSSTTTGISETTTTTTTTTIGDSITGGGGAGVTPRPNQRELVLGELLDTEQSYVDDLNVLIQYYLQPLRKLEVVSPSEILNVFSNAETILHLNSSILTEFNERKKANPNPIIGDILLKMAAYFKMYTSYCANHDTSLRVLDKWKKNPTVAKFFEDQRGKSACRGMNCEGFLIKPIQRLCKYPLLLRELIKNTPEEHPDYRNLINAQKQIEDVVTYVNEGRRSAENQQKIVDIQDSFDVELQLVSPSRRLVREGKLSLFKNGHLQPKQVYLFNDLLLIRRGRSKPLQVPIEELNIINHADQDTLKNVFELTYKGSGDKVALISFGSEEEKTLWFREIKKMVEDVQKKDILELKRRANSSAKLVDKTASSNSLTPSPSPSSSSSPSSPSSSPSTATLSPRSSSSPSSPLSSTTSSSSSVNKTAATKPTSLSTPSSASSTPTTAHLTNGDSGVEEGGSGIKDRVAVDGWLIGHLIFHKLTGKKLFEGSSLAEMVDTLANPHLPRTPPTLPDDLPAPAIELLNYCWQVGPQTGGGGVGAGKHLLGLKELMEQVEMVESNSKSKKKKSGRKGMAAAFTQRFLD